MELTAEQISNSKASIDAMTQEDMARLWRFAPAGHPYFVSGSELCKYFQARFQGFTPALSKRLEVPHDAP